MRGSAVLLCVTLLGVAVVSAKPSGKSSSKKSAPSRSKAIVDAGVPDGGEDAGPPPDPCGRNVTCGSCVTNMTATCAWCVETSTCVYSDEGACGASRMAREPPQCPPPGPPRAPPPLADSMVTQQAQNNAPAVTVKGMPDEALDALLDKFSEESSDDGKMVLLKEAAKTSSFTVPQILRLLDAFDVTAAKVNVCETLKNRVVDRKNIPQLYTRFKSEPDRKRVQKIMESGK